MYKSISFTQYSQTIKEKYPYLFRGNGNKKFKRHKYQEKKASRR